MNNLIHVKRGLRYQAGIFPDADAELNLAGFQG
jgi:hypothetical protein